MSLLLKSVQLDTSRFSVTKFFGHGVENKTGDDLLRPPPVSELLTIIFYSSPPSLIQVAATSAVNAVEKSIRLSVSISKTFSI